jgi:methyltransferase (TIGR00027 family)
VYVAVGRAMGAREPDETLRNPDFLAERLLGDTAALGVDHPWVSAIKVDYAAAIANPGFAGNITSMMVRTRFIDDCLWRAIAAGATQVVVLGAGFDTRAYRVTNTLPDVHVFEVDRAETQAMKRRRVDEALGGPPANLTYVAIDFVREDLSEVLARHGHDRAQKTFFIWEGVTRYLPEADVRKTFAFMASHAPGSAVVFDFVYQSMVDMIAATDMSRVPEMAKQWVQDFVDLLKDEPWVFGFPSNTERAYIEELGFEVRELLAIGGEEAGKRYLTRADGTRLGGQAPSGVAAYQLAEAVVTPPPAP